MKSYLEDIKELFKNYKYLGESFLISLPEKRWTWKANEDTNSIAIIIKHLAGNMLSRWTDFLTTDGEKEWRNREDEFIYQQESKAYLLEQWQRGWNCLFQALETLEENDLDKIVFIKNQAHSVREAINRQLTHYAYHVGQIVVLSKMSS